MMLLVLLAVGCGKKETTSDSTTTVTGDSAATAAPAVIALSASDVVTVQESNAVGGIEISGSLEPAKTVVIKAQVDGTLRGMRVDRGTPVSQGQTLVTIEALSLRGQVESARAAVASATADLAAADQNLAASRKLFEAGAISAIELKNTEAQQQAATARLEASRTQLAIAQERAGFAVVTSPLSGAVSDRPTDEGQAIRVGDVIMTLVDTRTLELDGRVGVEVAGSIRVGQKVSFTLDASPDKRYTGAIVRIDPSADPATRQVGLHAQLNNANRQVVAGQFAHGRIETGSAATKGLVVPTSAIRSGDDGSRYLIVIEGGRAMRRPVEIGETDQVGGFSVVKSGVSKGEQVLATSAAIADGARVQVAAGDSARTN